LVKIKIHEGALTCPKCGAPECDPRTTTPEGGYIKDVTRWVIRPFKVQDEKGDWSQCLRCAGVLDADFNETGKSLRDPEVGRKGWFVS
jgi:hypothetical protein